MNRLFVSTALYLALPLAAVPTAIMAQETPATPVAARMMTTAGFNVGFDPSSQVLTRLAPVGVKDFDFVPIMDGKIARAGDHYMYPGDLNLRLRAAGAEWQDFGSAHRRVAVRALRPRKGALMAADITPTMGAGFPLRVERRWVVDGKDLVLSFVLSNPGQAAIEIGGLGIPMVFDNVLTDRSLEQAHEQASFFDPYIGRDAGYLQVTRLNGKGPALLVMPEGRTPFEAYRPIYTGDGAMADKTRRGIPFEGFYDWMVASSGFAEKEWKAATPWNAPTTITLAPGQTRQIGVRFALSPSIRAIEDTLAAHRRPVAVGIPGYVVPTDLAADLFLKAPSAVAKIEVFPAGALTVAPASPTPHYKRYKVSGKTWGRARLELTYADGQVQSIQYFVTKPAAQVASDMGRFLTTKQWFDDPSDPFKRSPSVISYDRDTNTQVTQDPRVWIAGLSDEGGAGSWVGAIIKQLDNPDPAEIAKLERFVTEVVHGRLQVTEGPNAGGVKKSLLYYDPVAFPDYYKGKGWKADWPSWPKTAADDVGRSFNYPHVAVAYWTFYRLARDHEGLVKAHDWRWYLEQAYQTAIAMPKLAAHYTQFGQIEGETFIEILRDLKREGMTAEAATLEAAMKTRADHWTTLAYPFGSEMPWDSTGQAEVYAWMRYFGHQPQADLTREVILGYDPTVPHWGYNGSARRYWDFGFAGKTQRLERQLHHYGSALNAVPLFDAYRDNPSDFHLLRVAYGGLMGALTNMDEDGFGSAAFHAFPDMLRFDGYSGDHAMGFWGHAYATASYLVDDPEFGWIGFGGKVTPGKASVRIAPNDSARSRLFVAPAGLWITLDSGKIDSADYDLASRRVTLRLSTVGNHAAAARVRVETTVPGKDTYALRGGRIERGAYLVPVTNGAATIDLVRG